MSKYIENINNDIQQIISKTSISGMERLNQSLTHHFNESGKMLRPLIMCLVNEDLKGEFVNIRNFALALELIHNYSLIHDDLPSMDNDDYRRNQLTVHKKFGEDTAILTGDFLLTKAFEVITTGGNYNPNLLKAIGKLAFNANEKGMIGGQFLDLNTEYLNNREKVLTMYSLKTSALFKSSFAIPGIINGLTDDKINILEELGDKFGLYFQIKDDLSDIEEDEKVNKITILKYIDKNEVNKLLEDLKEGIMDKLEMLNLEKTKELIIDLYE